MADQKISELAELTDLADTDCAAMVDTSGNFTGRTSASTLKKYTSGGVHSTYFPDYTESDQGVAGNGKTAKAYIDTIATDAGTLVFQHNSGAATTTYTFSTSETFPSNIMVEIENGVILSIGNGITLTLGGFLDGGLYQMFSGSGSVAGCTKIDKIYPEWFGAKGDGVTDDTAAIQAAIDIAFNNGASVHICDGIFAVTGLKAYGILSQDLAGTILSGKATRLIFEGGASLKMTAASGFVIQASESPSQVIPTDEVLYGIIENPIIDMDSKGYVGLMLQCAQRWRIINPDIRKIPAGTFTYDDGHSSQTYKKTGLYIKGIMGVAGAYYNFITGVFLRGVSSAVKGNAGIYFGTTPGETAQRANFNIIKQATCVYCTTGIHIEKGHNQKIDMVDCVRCDTGIYVHTSRNLIIKPYLESCNTGINFTSNSSYNVLLGLASIASTITPVVDDGVDNLMFPENNLPRYTTLDAAGGQADQTITSNTWTKVTFDRELIDQGNQGNLVSNRITIDSNGDGEGLYVVRGWARINVVNEKRYIAAIYKNGVQLLPEENCFPGVSDCLTLTVSAVIFLDKDDYVELWVKQTDSVSTTLLSNGNTVLSAIKQVSYINKPFNR